MAERPGVELQRVEPKLFGRVPPLGLLGSGAVLFLVAVALLALADWVLGPLLLVLALVLLALYLVVARHLPPSRFARSAVGGVWRGRDGLRLAGVFAGAWTRAGWQVACLQRERRNFRRRHQAVQHELGGAVYCGDEADVERLRARMHDLDAEIAARTEQIERATFEARVRVDRARVPLRPTEINKSLGRS